MVVEVPIAEPNMAANESEISACFMRASLPFFISPVRWVTPISVPALSEAAFIATILADCSEAMFSATAWKMIVST